MAIKSYKNAAQFSAVERKLKASLKLTDPYLKEVSAVLMLKALKNIVGKNRPFQKNVEDVKDILPVVLRSDYFNNWKYKYKATCNGKSCNIIIRPNSQNGYEYAQLTFDGAALDLKGQLLEDDKVIIIKKNNSDVFEVFRIANTDKTFTENDDFIAINPSNTGDNTAFDAPAVEITVSNRNYPLNQILYGAPGTGKTHNAINHALAIATGKDLQELIDAEKANPANRKAAKDEFDELVKSGQIQFITFHQSYSYEEFVEGIKPSVNGSNVEYSIEEGIFKKLCLKATEKKSIKNFDSLYSEFISDLTESGNQLQLTTLIQKKPFSVRINSNGSCVAIPKTTTATEMTITKKVIQNFMESGIVDDWKPYTTSIAKYITDKYKPKTEAEDNTNKNFVLIIDEINRGNISKIFGELITLIEDSKRIGNAEALKIKLTYSGTNDKEKFGVPNNVYIVGTMNSADRSIALIDTALRRRFTFTEYTSDPSTLSDNIEGINLKLMLQKLNERIEFLLDKDHLLGHAYFLDVKTKNDLCGVFRNKILPLLEEYFFGNFEKIQQILGDNSGWKKTDQQKLVQEKKANTTTTLFGNTEDFEDKIIYQINPKLVEGKFDEITPDVFTSIYTKK
jgi:5-methylcytosine-specific restriction protein B